MSAKVVEVCLVANLQTLGPLYVGDTNRGLFDYNTGSLFAARLIITAGMGNSTVPFSKLHGPVPISELDSNEDYECYFFVVPMQQQPDPNTKFSTGQGSYITCIVIKSSVKSDFRSFEKHIENILLNNVSDIDFSNSMTGSLTSELKADVENKLISIYDKIEEILNLSPIFEGNSLYDVGLIASLPENFSKIAKKLILHPKGLMRNEIEDINAIAVLIDAGLLTVELRDNVEWLIPR